MSFVTQRPDINSLQDIVMNINYKFITNKQGAAENIFLVVKEYLNALLKFISGTLSHVGSYGTRTNQRNWGQITSVH